MAGVVGKHLASLVSLAFPWMAERMVRITINQDRMRCRLHLENGLCSQGTYMVRELRASEEYRVNAVLSGRLDMCQAACQTSPANIRLRHTWGSLNAIYSLLLHTRKC
jgi:hypothetical protein